MKNGEWGKKNVSLLHSIYPDNFKMYKAYRYFYKLPTAKIILLGVCLPLVANVLMVGIGIITGITGNDDLSYQTNIGNLLIMVILAPFLETVAVQYAPLKIAGWLINNSKRAFLYTILIISVIFGLLHHKSALYMAVAFFYGIVWTSACFLFIRRKQHPILFTWMIHACYNGLLFGLSFLVRCIENPS